MKKMFFYLFIIVSIFLIYKLTFKYEINYVVLGDSLSNGKYSYSENGYGFTSYVKDYLKKLDMLGNYDSNFTTNDCRINDIFNDIKTNKNNIRKLLRESSLVTITVGANDILSNININNIDIELKNMNLIKLRIDSIAYEFNKLVLEIKKYAKGDIIVIGYYNPFPYSKVNKPKIDELVSYLNKKYEVISNNNKIYYIDIFDIFDNNFKYLPNPYDMHPNILGYKAIFSKVKTLLDNKIIKID